MNVLILAAGPMPPEAKDNSYPLCLTEINGIPIIEKIINNITKLGDVNFAIILNKEDARRYHLDNIVRLLSPSIQVFIVDNQTHGAACSALLAIEFIENFDELLILNANELIDADLSNIVDSFRKQDFAAGVITFSSIHPRYSFVKLNENSLVIAAAEKEPISRHATAGFYWFSSGTLFVEAAKSMIRKRASVNSQYYICPTLNELILKQLKIGTFQIDANSYHPFKMAQDFNFINKDSKEHNEKL